MGAGSGRDSIELARRGARVTVIDYVRSSLGVVAANADEAGVATHHGLRRTAPGCPSRRAPSTWCSTRGCWSISAIRSPWSSDNRRVLKTGGHVVIDVPQRWHIYTVGKKVMIALNRWFAGWETEFSIRELRGSSRAQGFEVVVALRRLDDPGILLPRVALRRCARWACSHPAPAQLVGPLGRANDAWRNWFRKRPPGLLDLRHDRRGGEEGVSYRICLVSPIAT